MRDRPLYQLPTKTAKTFSLLKMPLFEWCDPVFFISYIQNSIS